MFTYDGDMDKKIVVSMVKGALSFAPFTKDIVCRSTGGTSDARYCLAVWMRHFAQVRRFGGWRLQGNIAELGPGDSIGIGLCAMLSGCDNYLALDARAYGSNASHRALLGELISYFSGDTPVADANDFPAIWPDPLLNVCPSTLLGMRPDNQTISAVVDALERLGRPLAGNVPNRISYVAPWTGTALSNHPSEIGLVFSQAVLEHVDDLNGTYQSLGAKLKAGALMSHTIDFTSHGITTAWHGHWSIDSRSWRIIRGRRPYLINRMPWSFHKQLLIASGFEILNEERRLAVPPDIKNISTSLLPLFTQEDLSTAGVYVLARKR